MFSRIIYCFLFCLLTTHVAAKIQSPPTPFTQPPATVPAFTHVYIDGAIDVRLHTDTRQSKLLFRADARDLAYVNWSINNGVLSISLGKGRPVFSRVHVDISTQFLSGFTYHGAGNIVANPIRSNGLDLVIDNVGKANFDGYLVLRTLVVRGAGVTQIGKVNSRNLIAKIGGSQHVELRGIANIASLEARGKAWFSLFWVKSNNLCMRLYGNAFVQLAGIAKMLDAELWGNAHFNGRYLRTTRAFVKTHDHAEADLAVLKRQHTLATDASNIYFYKLPEMKADFMALNGSVLDMRDWAPSIFEEPTRYNS